MRSQDVACTNGRIRGSMGTSTHGTAMPGQSRDSIRRLNTAPPQADEPPSAKP